MPVIGTMIMLIALFVGNLSDEGEYYNLGRFTKLFTIPWGNEKGKLSLKLLELGPKYQVWNADFPISVNDKGNRIIIGDRVKNQVYKFDEKGNLLLHIDLKGEEWELVDLCLDIKGNIIVLRFCRKERPAENGVIQIFDRKGRLVKQFKPLIPISESSLIFIDNSGNIYVKRRSIWDFNIVRFNKDGHLIDRFKGDKLVNSAITLDGKIFALDLDNTLYIVDKPSSLKAVKRDVFPNELVYRPIGSDKKGNLYFVRFYFFQPKVRTMDFIKLSPSGNVLFSETVNIPPTQYQGKELACINIFSPSWLGANIDIDGDGNIYSTFAVI